MLKEHGDDPEKANPAIAEVLARFPDDLKVLECAAQFYERIGDMAKAHACIKRALAANPLDRELRGQAAGLALHEARQRGGEGEFDAARAALREAADLGGGAATPAIQALAAAVELRAHNAEAFQTHRDALMNQPDGRLAGAYRLMVEGSRLKLKKKDMGPYQAEYAERLAGPVTAKDLSPLIDAVAQYQQEPTKYRGLLTHAKKILERVVEVGTSDISEDDLLLLALAVHDYNLFKPLQPIANAGVRRFPNNPYFHFFQAEAMVSRQRSEYINYNVGSAYRRAKNLIDQAKDGRYRALQDRLDERVKQTPEVGRWLNDRWDW